MPILYIGQTDELRKRLDQHVATKEFWDRCVVFVSSNNFLNRAHVTWLEWKLYQGATQIGQCILNNAQAPQEPSLSEAEKADGRMVAIYHSHIDVDAYFSEEDHNAATFFGEPTYPGVVYPVISVKDGQVDRGGEKIFRWDDSSLKFKEVTDGEA